jgi:hypothetical protein
VSEVANAKFETIHLKLIDVLLIRTLFFLSATPIGGGAIAAPGPPGRVTFTALVKLLPLAPMGFGVNGRAAIDPDRFGC